MNNARITEVDTENGKIPVMSIPLKNEDLNMLSNLIIFFNENEKIQTYQETHVTESEENTFQIATYTDGKLVGEEKTDIEYVSNEEFEKEYQQLERSARSLSSSEKCMIQKAAVSAAIISVILFVCYVACTTIPFSCKGCLTGGFALSTAALTSILACIS